MKLVAPDSQRVLPRPRLYELIDSHEQAAAVWISGPPGSGKTMLASSYLAASTATGGWYKLDEGDAEPTSFFYFISQLACLLASSELPPFPPLTPDRMPGLGAYARSAFRALYSHLSMPLLLVFDDFHVLPPDAPTVELLRIAIEELPSGSRILVLSREPAPASFADLQLYGRLATLGWPELQLDESEVRRLVRASLGKDLEEGEFRALLRRADGWVTGWVLLLQQTGHPWGASDTNIASHSSPQILFDYFTSELFEQQSPELQRFLMETAFLPCLTADTVGSLTGAEDAEEILQQLLGTQFMNRQSAGGVNSFAYHDLYRDFLQQQAHKRLSEAALSDLKHRVAQALEAHGNLVEAIPCYASLKDWPAVVRLAHQHVPVLVAQGRTAMVRTWLSQLPAEILDTCPWLSYWWGISSFPAAMEQAQQQLEMAYRGFAERDDVHGMLLAAAGIIQILSFIVTDEKVLRDWLRRMLELAPAPEQLPEGTAGAYVAAAILSGYTIREPGHPDVGQWREAAIVLAERSGDPLLQARILYMASFSAGVRGEMDAVERFVERLNSLAGMHLAIPTVGILARMAAVILHINRAEWDAELAAVEEGLQLAAQSDVHFMDPMLAGNGVHAGLMSGRPDLVEVYSGMLSAMLELQRPLERSLTEWTLGLAAYARGEFQSALEFGQRALQRVEAVGMVYPMFVSRSLIIQSLCALERYAEAWSRLLENGSLTDRVGSRFLALEHRFLSSYVMSVSGQHAEAVTELQAAWKAWINRGQQFFYTLQRPVIRHLGMLALSNGINPRTIKVWFDRFRLEPDGDSSALETWPWPLKIYTLGRFCVVRDGVPMNFDGRAQMKPLELLKALVALGGRGVAQEHLAEALWQDSEGDAAMRACSTTLYRLRKLLGDERWITVGDNSITLDARYCWVDTWAFERAVSEGRGGSTQFLRRAIALYRGHFLENAASAPWMLRPRERLRTRFVAAVRDASRMLRERGQCVEACQVAEQGLAIDDLVEDFYVALMLCYQCVGQHGEALNMYSRCERRLQDALGAQPSLRIRKLYRCIADEVGGGAT